MKKLVNIVEQLRLRATDRPSQTALICPSGSLSYAEVEEQSNRCAQGLARIGIGPGTRTVLMVRPGAEFVVLIFALLKNGAIPVLVDPGMGWRNLGRCLQEARPRAFIGIPLAHLAGILLGWARGTLRTRVTVGGFAPGFAFRYRSLLRESGGETRGTAGGLELDAPAALVFTSGSTGVPKGVVYTHRMFSSGVELLREHFDICPGEVDLATFPLFALWDPAWGVTSVFPEMDFSRPGKVDPTEIIRRVQDHQVTHLFGSPALLDRVGRYAETKGIKLTSVRRVLTAGAPVSTQVLERFARLLPEEAEIFTPYGATEALPVCSIGSRELLKESGAVEGKGVCLGRPIPGVNLAIIRITDGPLGDWSNELQVPDGTVGEIVVWGDNVSNEYFGRPEADRLAKIRGPDGEIRHRMGDLGYRDEQGRVWFSGRKSHRVITANGVLYSVPCEGVFNQHPEVRRTALVGLGLPPGQKPVLCVEVEDKRRWRGSVRLRDEILELGSRFPQTREIKTVFFHRSFPVDIRHNAKIFREKLAVWASRQAAAGAGE